MRLCARFKAITSQRLTKAYQSTASHPVQRRDEICWTKRLRPLPQSAPCRPVRGSTDGGLPRVTGPRLGTGGLPWTDDGAVGTPSPRTQRRLASASTAPAGVIPDSRDSRRPFMRSRPLADRPDQVRPLADRPDQVRPLADRPDQVRPLADRPDQVLPLADRPDQVLPLADRPDQVRPLADRPDQVRPLADRPDQVRPLADRPDQVLPLADRPDQVRPLADRPDQVRPLADRPDQVLPRADRPDQVNTGHTQANSDTTHTQPPR